MTAQAAENLTYDPSNAYLPEHGLSPTDLTDLGPKLDAARAEVWADLQLLRSGDPIPEHKKPLDAGFIDLPDRLLTDHRAHPETSELSRILLAADQLRSTVDRVVVIGIGGSYMGTRSLFEACCHPYHNELSRANRADRPRLYFAGYNVSNDATGGLIEILSNSRSDELKDRWGIICVSKSGDTLETAIAFRQFFNLLREGTQGTDWLSKLVWLVTGPESKLHQFAKKSLSTEVFFIPPDVGGRYSIFTACGLLPAAVLGLDIVQLLEGAIAMTNRFRSDGVGSSPVLDFVGICHLMEHRQGAGMRLLSLWDQNLEALGFWYDQLLSESLGKKEQGATPLTVVNTRDLHSRGQQHQQGKRDKLITNVILQRVRRPPQPIGPSDSDHDGLNRIAGKTLPEIAKAALDGTTQAYKEDNRPTTNIYLPAADEFSLGQLYQMLMLATSLEGYLIGINPYGQPGVEAYKKHMKSFLFGRSS